jgi:hypothetical protein
MVYVISICAKLINKGNNKITELRTILQRESQRKTVKTVMTAYPKKWWVESDFKVPNLPLSLRLKVPGCHYNSIYDQYNMT